MAEKKQLRLLFISTNTIWGGSEVVWTAAAKYLQHQGFDVEVGLYYDYENMENEFTVPVKYHDLRTYPQNRSIFQRILRKAGLVNNVIQTPLQKLMAENKFSLVIISQGNNIDGLPIMKECNTCNTRFVTLTHLVNEFFWPFITDDLISELNANYGKAVKNFFVSPALHTLHEKIMGTSVKNASIAFNPFTKSSSAISTFPGLQHGYYKVALIGRLELFHKGYDLLVDIVKQPKWQERNIHFSIYGKGPHRDLLNRLIQQYTIGNISLHDHEADISRIWDHHHILLLPSRMEGQSLTLIEALNFKRPAIVTAVGGARELVLEGENGFVANDATLHSIDQALERAWENRSRWEEMGETGYLHIKETYPADAVASFAAELTSLAGTNPVIAA